MIKIRYIVSILIVVTYSTFLVFRSEVESQEKSDSPYPMNYYEAEVTYAPGFDDCSSNIVVDPDFSNPELNAWSGDIELEDLQLGFGENTLKMSARPSSKEVIVTQRIRIPATGNARLILGFFIKNPGAAQLDIQINGNSLLDSPVLDGKSPGLQEVLVDMSAFADGNPYDLSFKVSPRTDSTNGTPTIFYIPAVRVFTGSDCNGAWGIEISPGYLWFGNIPLGSTKTIDVKIYNTGATPLIGELGSSEFYSVDPKLRAYTIAPGGVATLPITFSPHKETIHGYWREIRFHGGGGKEIIANGAVVTGTLSPYNRRIVINEVSAWNESGPRDQEHEYSDWIELKNYEFEHILMDGWKLEYTPEGGVTKTWEFPQGTTIGSDGGMLIIYASGKSGTESDSGLHTNFVLNHTVQSRLRLINAAGEDTRHSPLQLPITNSPDESWSFVDPADSTDRPDPNNIGPVAGRYIWFSADTTTIGGRNR